MNRLLVLVMVGRCIFEEFLSKEAVLEVPPAEETVRRVEVFA
jgi:hypothetical protein